MGLSELDAISVACIVFYTPALFVSSYLAFIHGFRRNAGWLYLVIFSIIRLMSASLQLASVYSSPGNLNLIIGAQTLLSVGISALVLTMLGLLSRVLESISTYGGEDTLVKPRYIRWVQLLVIVGLVLGIVGGSLSGSSVSSGQGFKITGETKIGLGFMIAGFGIVVIATILTASQVSRAEKGEKRLLSAVAGAIPFVAVRVVFSSIAVWGNNPDFSAFRGSTKYANYLLGMAIIMEMCCVAIFEAVGLTLRRRTKEESARVGEWVNQGAKGGLLTGGSKGLVRLFKKRQERRKARWNRRFGGGDGQQTAQV